MVKHIILTDAALDSADILLVTRGTLPQTIGSLTAGDYTVRDTSSPVAGTVTEAAAPPDPGEDWYDSRAMIDLDYENDRAYVNGTAYGSIAAARAAGAVAVNAHGNDTVAISDPGASYVLAGRGATPTVIGNEYIVAMDDGSNTNLVYIGTSATGASKAGGWLASGTSRLSQSTSAISADAAFRAAVRIKSGAGLLSFNGAAGSSGTSTVLPGGISTFVAANRSAGDRGWSGALHRVMLIDADLTDAEVHALLA